MKFRGSVDFRPWNPYY